MESIQADTVTHESHALNKGKKNGGRICDDKKDFNLTQIEPKTGIIWQDGNVKTGRKYRSATHGNSMGMEKYGASLQSLSFFF